jgi:hypothetical protein
MFSFTLISDPVIEISLFKQILKIRFLMLGDGSKSILEMLHFKEIMMMYTVQEIVTNCEISLLMSG